MKISESRLRFIVDYLEIEGINYLADTIKDHWYPEVFREKSLLEVGKWYEWDDKETDHNVLICITEIGNNEIIAYGFLDGHYVNKGVFYRGVNNFKDAERNLKPASKESILKALSNEAVRRGFKQDGTVYHFKSLISRHNVITSYSGPKCRKFDLSETGDLYLGGCVIFHKGQWIEPIETISKEEAEKQLGKKIV